MTLSAIAASSNKLSIPPFIHKLCPVELVPMQKVLYKKVYNKVFYLIAHTNMYSVIGGTLRLHNI